MSKPLKVDNVWLERIAGMLDEMEFGSLSIIVHEGQIVQLERTERRRYDVGGGVAKAPGSSRNAVKPLRKSESR